jgi:MFS transporter, DHA1 family, inner membrane transport protein
MELPHLSPPSPTRSGLPSPPYGVGAAELALSLGAFTLGISEFAAMGLLPSVAEGLHVSIPKAGLTISAYAVGVVVGAPLMALLLARCPRRILLVLLALLMAAGNLASALAPNFGVMIAARLMSGLPHGAYLGTAAMIAASLVPAHKRASAVARVILGLSIANLIGVPLVTWLGQIAGWRSAFGLVAAFAVLTAISVRVCLPWIGAGPSIGLKREVAAVLAPQVLLALGIAAVGFGGMFAIYSYLAPTLTQVTGLRPAAIPLMLSVFGLGMVTGNIAGGWLADRGVVRAIGIALVLAAAAQFFFLFAPFRLPTMVIDVFLIGATSMALGPSLQTRLLDVAPDAQMLAASLNHSAFNCANALGAWLGGLVIAAGFGWTATGGVGAILTIAGLIVFGAAVLLDRSRLA